MWLGYGYKKTVSPKILAEEKKQRGSKMGYCLYTVNIGAYSTASSTKFNGFEGAKILHINN
jgi:hypothetical protein